MLADADDQRRLPLQCFTAPLEDRRYEQAEGQAQQTEREILAATLLARDRGDDQR
jgi:hypothetical protein